MEPTYRVYFAGEVLEGHNAAEVRANLGKLFKADAATLDKLFSGQPQLVKRDCDKATALKYKQALEKSGARPLIRSAADSDAGQRGAAAQPATDSAAPEAAQSPQADQPAAAPPAMTAAERIAALAQAPATIAFKSSAQAADDNAGDRADQDGAFGVAPAGSDVLRPEERSVQEARDIDTSTLAVDAAAERLSEPGAAPPSAPDTQHLSMGAVGEDIPTLPDERNTVDPDISGIDLAPSGTDFSDCATPDAQPPELDLSALDMAEVGSDVLDEQYRQREAPPAPATDHLQIQTPRDQ
mgnify:CR=1 FL=1|tara:strand:+ start:207598 stop:208488 length:891 start_codon:yes stop_codon:yes gene_type:complete